MKQIGLLIILTIFSTLNVHKATADNIKDEVISQCVEQCQPKLTGAAVIKNGSLYCISLKKVVDYDTYVEEGFPELAQKLKDDSDCFIKRKQESVLVVSKSKNYAEYQTPKGFKVWTRSENIIK